MAKKRVIKKKESNPLDKQAMLVFSAIVVFLIALISTPYIYHQLFEKFSYAGINFEKTKYEKVTFYHGTFPVIYQGKFIHYYEMYLRTDPRINDIPLTTNVSISKKVSISFEPTATFCKSAVLGQSLIGQFLSAFPWVEKIDMATNDSEMARAQNWSYITCDNASSDHTVFMIQKSNSPSIDKGEKDNCFIIKVGECQNIETIERFVVGTIAQINKAKI